jgi:hypothetical protein
MSKFGWCFGPEGAIGDHGSCPGELGADGTILRCGCACHEGASDRTFPLQAWENVASPQGALTPAGSNHLPLLQNERG